MAALPASLALAALVALPCLVAVTLPALAIAVLRLELRSALRIGSVIGVLLVASAMAGIVVASDASQVGTFLDFRDIRESLLRNLNWHRTTHRGLADTE